MDTLYTYRMKISCRNRPIDLDVYVDDKDCVVGIYYAHCTMRGSVFRTLFTKNIPVHPNPQSLTIVQELHQFFNKKNTAYTKPFTASYRFIGGSKFQISVWNEIATIPIHHVVSYKHIASKISPSSPSLLSRAVGNAVGTNPLSILIPCHRVLPQSFVDKWKSLDITACNIGNYGGGSEIKRDLLLHERSLCSE